MTFYRANGHLYFESTDDSSYSGKNHPLGYSVSALPAGLVKLSREVTSEPLRPLHRGLLDATLMRHATVPPLPHSPRGASERSKSPPPLKAQPLMSPPLPLDAQQRRGLQRPYEHLSKVKEASSRYSMYVGMDTPLSDKRDLPSYLKLLGRVDQARDRIMLAKREEASRTIAHWAVLEAMRQALVDCQHEEKDLRCLIEEEAMLSTYIEPELRELNGAQRMERRRRDEVAREVRHERRRKAREEAEENLRKEQDIARVKFLHGAFHMMSKTMLMELETREAILRRSYREELRIRREKFATHMASDLERVYEYFAFRAETERELSRLMDAEPGPRRVLEDTESVLRAEYNHEFYSSFPAGLLHNNSIPKEFQRKLRKAVLQKLDMSEAKQRGIVMSAETTALFDVIQRGSTSRAEALAATSKRQRFEQEQKNELSKEETSFRGTIADLEFKLRTKFAKTYFVELASVTALARVDEEDLQAQGAAAEHEAADFEALGAMLGHMESLTPKSRSRPKGSHLLMRGDGSAQRILIVDDLKELAVLSSKPLAMYGCGEVPVLKRPTMAFKEQSEGTLVISGDLDLGDRLYVRTDTALQEEAGVLTVAGLPIAEFDASIGGGNHRVGIRIRKEMKPDMINFILKQVYFTPAAYMEGHQTMKIKNILVKAQVGATESLVSVQVICVAPYIFLKPLYQINSLEHNATLIYPFEKISSPIEPHTAVSHALKGGILQISVKAVKENATLEWDLLTLSRGIIDPIHEMSSPFVLVARLITSSIPDIVEVVRRLMVRCKEPSPFSVRATLIEMHVLDSTRSPFSNTIETSFTFVSPPSETSLKLVLPGATATAPSHAMKIYRGNHGVKGATNQYNDWSSNDTGTDLNASEKYGLDTNLYFLKDASLVSTDPALTSIVSFFRAAFITVDVTPFYKGDMMDLKLNTKAKDAVHPSVVRGTGLFIRVAFHCKASTVEDLLRSVYFRGETQGIRTVTVTVSVVNLSGQACVVTERVEIRVAAPLLSLQPSFMSYHERSGARRILGFDCPRDKTFNSSVGIYAGGYLHVDVVEGHDPGFDFVEVSPGLVCNGGEISISDSGKTIQHYKSTVAIVKIVDLAEPTASDSTARVMTMEFTSPDSNPLSRKALRHILKALTFTHTSDSPEVKKTLRISMGDGRGGSSYVLLYIEISPFDDPASILLGDAVMQFHPGCAKALRGYCLFDRAKIIDPDITCINTFGSFLHVELIGGGNGDGHDVLGLLSPEVQAQSKGSDHHVVTASAEGCLLMNGEAIGSVTRKSMMPNGAQPGATMLIEFTTGLRLTAVEYILQCITYDYTAQKEIFPGVRTFQVRYKSGHNEYDIKEKICVAVHKPTISAPLSSKPIFYKENQPPVVIAPRINVHISEKESLAKCLLRVEISSGGHSNQDILWMLPQLCDGLTLSPDGYISLLHLGMRQPVGRLSRCGPNAIQLVFTQDSAGKGKHLSAICRAFTYHNSSSNPIIDERLVDIMFAQATEVHDEAGTLSLVRVSVNCIPEDDMTEFADMPTDLVYVSSSKNPLLALCPKAIVTDPDTFIFEAPHSYLTCEVISGTSMGDLLTFEDPGLTILNGKVSLEDTPLGTLETSKSRCAVKINLDACPIAKLQQLVRSLGFRTSVNRHQDSQQRRVQISVRGGPTVQPTVHFINVNVVRPLVDVPVLLKNNKCTFPANICTNVRVSDVFEVFDGAVLTIRRLEVTDPGAKVTQILNQGTLTLEPPLSTGLSLDESGTVILMPGGRKGTRDPLAEILSTGEQASVIQVKFVSTQKATNSMVTAVLQSVVLSWPEAALTRACCVAIEVTLDLALGDNTSQEVQRSSTVIYPMLEDSVGGKRDKV